MNRTSKGNRNKRQLPSKRRKPRNNTGSRYSDSDTTVICHGPDRDKSPSWRRNRRMINKERGSRSRSGSPEDDIPGPRGRRGTDDEIKSAFHVESVNYNIAANTRAHHTDKFACTEKLKPTLVVRRGQPFLLTLKLDRKYEKETHDLLFCFSAGEAPKPPKGTAVCIEMDEDPKGTCKNHKEWYAKMTSNDMKNCQIKVEITPPSNCIIGDWDCCIETSFRNNPSDRPLKCRYECKSEIIILFNPWCQNDTVYFPRQDELEEYILLQYGCVYTGNFKQPEPKRWDHGQFETNNLEVILSLLMKHFNNVVDRRMANPIQLTRAISSVVNSVNGGVLQGNWSGEYEGGIPPLKWKSSTTILQKYNEDCSAVKYGQCWVFSALTTTICRALGIPCRSVTNFCSAHDTDGSCRIDKEFYIDEDGKRCSITPGDSIWNFHVWNEAWMTRPDIGKGADGWQAFDATPQEESEGDLQCGPAPVCGIKTGHIDWNYDAPFIFAEVNSDVLHWINLGRGEWRLIKWIKNKVGKSISTKDPDGKPFNEPLLGLFGGTDRLDLTENYKYPEGSQEERLVVQCAGKYRDNKHKADEVMDDDVELTIDVKDGTVFGNSFEINVSAKNVALQKGERTLHKVSLELASCSSNGVVGRSFYKTKSNETLTIPYLKEKDFEPFKINYEDYAQGLKSPYALAITVKATIEETKESITEEDTDFRLRRPVISINAPDETPAGEKFQVKFTAKTPFKKKLTNCFYSITGTRIDDIERTAIDPRYLTNDGTWEQKVELTPIRKGEASIAVDFDCDQIEDVEGCINICIT